MATTTFEFEDCEFYGYYYPDDYGACQFVHIRIPVEEGFDRDSIIRLAHEKCANQEMHADAEICIQRACDMYATNAPKSDEYCSWAEDSKIHIVYYAHNVYASGGCGSSSGEGYYNSVHWEV